MQKEANDKPQKLSLKRKKRKQEPKVSQNKIDVLKTNLDETNDFQNGRSLTKQLSDKQNLNSIEDGSKAQTGFADTCSEIKEVKEDNAYTDFSSEKTVSCALCSEVVPKKEMASHLTQCFKKFGHQQTQEKNSCDKSVFKCQICEKDLSHMTTQRRSQHVNKCIDKIENETNQTEEKKKQLEAARHIVLACPMCGKPFKSENMRKNHLKKCASTLNIGTSDMLRLVKAQEEERDINLAAGILPNELKTGKMKGKKTTSTKNIKEPKNKYEEEIQMAMALSKSMNLAGRETNLEEEAYGINNQKNKKRKKKQGCLETTHILLTRTESDRRQILEEKIANLIMTAKNDENIDEQKEKLSVHKTVHWKNCAFLSDADVKSLWSGPSYPATEAFYVSSLMPPITVSKVETGSKVKRMSEIPGYKRRVSFVPEITNNHNEDTQTPESDMETMVASTQTAVVLAELAAADITSSHEQDPLSCSGFCLPPQVKLKDDVQTKLFNSLGHSLLSQLNSKDKSDITIITSDENVYANSFILACRCPAFLQEKKEENSIYLSDYSSDTVLAFLKYVYAAQVSFDPDLLGDVKSLAKRFQVDELLDACEHVVVDQNIENKTLSAKEDVDETEPEDDMELLVKEFLEESSDESVDGKDMGDDLNSEEINDSDYDDIRSSQRQKLGYMSKADICENSNDEQESEVTDMDSPCCDSRNVSRQEKVNRSILEILQKKKTELSQLIEENIYPHSSKDLCTNNYELKDFEEEESSNANGFQANTSQQQKISKSQQCDAELKQTHLLKIEGKERFSSEIEVNSCPIENNSKETTTFMNNKRDKSFDENVGVNNSQCNSTNVPSIDKNLPTKNDSLNAEDIIECLDSPLHSPNVSPVKCIELEDDIEVIPDVSVHEEYSSPVLPKRKRKKESPKKKSPVVVSTPKDRSLCQDLSGQDLSGQDLFGTPSPDLFPQKRRKTMDGSDTSELSDINVTITSRKCLKKSFSPKNSTTPESAHARLLTISPNSSAFTENKSIHEEDNAKVGEKLSFSVARSDLENVSPNKNKMEELDISCEKSPSREDVRIVSDNFKSIGSNSPIFSQNEKKTWKFKKTCSYESSSSKKLLNATHTDSKESFENEIHKRKSNESPEKQSLCTSPGDVWEDFNDSGAGLMDCDLYDENVEGGSKKEETAMNRSIDSEPVDLTADSSDLQEHVHISPEKSAGNRASSPESCNSMSPVIDVLDQERPVVVDLSLHEDVQDMSAGNIGYVPKDKSHLTNVWEDFNDSGGYDAEALQNDHDLADLGRQEVNEENDLVDDSAIWHDDNEPNHTLCEQEQVNTFKTPVEKKKQPPSKVWQPPSPFTPMPAYDKMKTPDLKHEMQKFGVKPVGKKRMVQMLKDIYQQTHQYETDSEFEQSMEEHSVTPKLPVKFMKNSSAVSCKVTSSSTDISVKKKLLDTKMASLLSNDSNTDHASEHTEQDSDALEDEEFNCSQDSERSEMLEETFNVSEDEESEMLSSQMDGFSLQEKLHTFLLQREDIYCKVLMYEPLEIDWLKKEIKESGIKCSMEKLLDFLDSKCIIFTMKNMRKNRGRNKSPKKKSPKKKSPRKEKKVS